MSDLAAPASAPGSHRPPDPGSDPEPRTLSLLGVPVEDLTLPQALTTLEALLSGPAGACHPIFFVNAHTLNLAFEDPDYRAVLGSAHRVFGDGTGVRWAARILHGVRLRDNVNGTDLVPALFAAFRDRGFRYYLLGASADAIERAADHARQAFPGWELVGHHHGYLDDETSPPVIEAINAARPHLLLVGMGNPKQERWLAKHRDRLDVRVGMGTGGLFDYWAGDLDRAPAWVRRLGSEWVHLLLRQPRKLRRYLVGNPLFLWRLVRARWLGGPDGRG
ncbi:MAG: WecB/TagA/CpsF family glycosyltransferase [Myxococcales bacterium]|nr:WecB/TagA/CpsF family glycosyltransferase [Myxococcales bacterium]